MSYYEHALSRYFAPELCDKCGRPGDGDIIQCPCGCGHKFHREVCLGLDQPAPAMVKCFGCKREFGAACVQMVDWELYCARCAVAAMAALCMDAYAGATQEVA